MLGNDIKFEQYTRGCNELGSLLESCVELVKQLIIVLMEKQS